MPRKRFLPGDLKVLKIPGQEIVLHQVKGRVSTGEKEVEGLLPIFLS
jgi:hypothetical protein